MWSELYQGLTNRNIGLLTEEQQNKLKSSLLKSSSTVLEIKTDSSLSKKMRKKFWADVVKEIEKDFTVK